MISVVHVCPSTHLNYYVVVLRSSTTYHLYYDASHVDQGRTLSVRCNTHSYYCIWWDTPTIRVFWQQRHPADDRADLETPHRRNNQSFLWLVVAGGRRENVTKKPCPASRAVLYFTT
jgi:hypothetical protein